MSQSTSDEVLSPKMIAMLKVLRSDHDAGRISVKPSYFGLQTTWRNLLKRGIITETKPMKNEPSVGTLTELGLSYDMDTFQAGK